MPYNYFYAKNGDAADQFERISANQDHISKSGPDAFLSDFLSNTKHQKLWLYSRLQETRKIEQDSVVAEVLTDGKTPVAKFFRRSLICLDLVAKLLKRRADRIICGSSGSRFWLCYLGARLTGAQIVHSRHNRISVNEGSSLPRRFSQKIDQLIARNCNAVVCHGPYLLDELVNCGVDADRIFEFDVDFSEFANKIHPDSITLLPETARTNKLLLFVGRVEEEKGVFDLLAAFSRIAKDNPNTDLALAGSGDSADQVVQEATRLGLVDRVHMLGRVAHTHLAGLMAHSLAVVTPSRPGFPEGRCMAAMEAYVAGTPGIARNGGLFSRYTGNRPRLRAIPISGAAPKQWFALFCRRFNGPS